MPMNNSEVAVENARFILAHYNQGAEFDHAGFLGEMDKRAAHVGKKLTAKQYKLLARIVAAYLDEFPQVMKSISNGFGGAQS